MSIQTTITLPEALLHKIKELVNQGEFSSISGLIEVALNHYLPRNKLYAMLVAQDIAQRSKKEPKNTRETVIPSINGDIRIKET